MSQSGGAFSGGSSCNGKTAISVAAFNASAPTGGQYYLCGTVTSQVKINGSGSSGTPLVFTFDVGASITLPACDNTNGCLNVAGKSYIIVDGGTPCGPGTACSTALTGTGIIQETANGSGLANQQNSIAIQATGGCTNCEFRNLIIGPLYQHTSPTDVFPFVADGAIYMNGCNGCTTKIHDSTIHDMSAGLNYLPASAGDSGLQFYNMYMYNYNGGINLAASESSEILSGASIHNSYFGSTANWDAPLSGGSCKYHHDGIHAWGEFGGEVTGVQFYDNIVTGDYGGCPTGAIFFEGYTGNSNFYNNVFSTTYTTMSNGIVNIDGFNIGFYNNTILGALQPSDICFVTGYGSDSSFVYTPSISFENNILQNCHTLIEQTPAGGPVVMTAWDYNAYGNLPSLGTLVYNGSPYASLAAWRTGCGNPTNGSCDHNSVIPSGGISASLGLVGGIPSPGSPVVGVGVNLTALGLTGLNFDYTGTPRPATGPWTIGAYQNPPTILQGTWSGTNH